MTGNEFMFYLSITLFGLLSIFYVGLCIWIVIKKHQIKRREKKDIV